MNWSFRRALLSGASLLLPIGLAAIDPDPIADEDAQLQDEGDILATGSVVALVNVRNVGNEKYLASLMWGQALHAAPRGANISLGFAC